MATITIAAIANAAEAGFLQGQFLITVSEAPTSNLTVSYSVAGSATAANDYTALTGTAVIFAGQTTTTINVNPLDDPTVEDPETIIVTLLDGVDYDLGATTQAQVTIASDDTNVTLAVSPTSVQEDGSNLVYTFTRAGVTSNALTVNYTVAGDAAAGTDYTGAITGTNSVTFAAGAATATVTIDPTGDTTVEADETVALTLAAATGNNNYIIGTIGTVTSTIADDDSPRVSLTVSPASVQEDGTTDLVYTFTRTVTTSALTANYSVGGTAILNTDYIQTGAATFTETAGTVTFAAGVATATVTINPTIDTVLEPNETVDLILTAGAGYTLGTTGAVTGTIVDDDTNITLAVSPASVEEDGTANLVYTFTRTGAAANALTVNYTVGGTATFGTDYGNTPAGAATFTATTGTVVFAAGATTATVTIDPTVDTTIEQPDETVALTLATGTGYTILGTPAAVTGTIADDDTGRISLAVSPASVQEDGTSNLVYTFERDGSTVNALTVNYTVAGTATLGTDYTQTGAATFTSTTGTITFPAGSEVATVTIDSTPDATVEPSETVILTLATGDGYTRSTTTAVSGTIANDDTNVILAVSPSSVQEDGTTNLVYTFTREGVTNNSLTVNYAVGGTATLATDYIAVNAPTFTGTTGTAIFASGSNTATITIDAIPDNTGETDETVVLTLGSGTGYTIGTSTGVTGTIANDDVVLPSISLAISPESVDEDGTPNLVYTFTRTLTANALTVNYTVGGAAVFNTDYAVIGSASFSETTGSVVFAAGASTALVTIDPTADTTPEQDETVVLTLAAGTGYTIETLTAVTGTIADDDAVVVTPTATIAATDAAASEESGNNGQFTITLSDAAPVGGLTVSYGVTGTATPATDYTALTGSVTIAAGATTATIAVLPVEDAIVEGNESVIVTLTDGAAYDLGAATVATVTIADDVAPNWTLDIDGDGTVQALSDGIIAVRYLIGGFPGDALINGAIDPDATRDLAEIQSYLQQGVDQNFLDIDGDGSVQALSDGIIAVRYLIGGFPGDALINGAIDPDATRDLAGIQSYLADLTAIV